MKGPVLTLLLIIFFCSLALAIKPPAFIQKAFEAKFANAGKVNWSKENAHEFEAEFVMDGLSYSANFSDKGEWLETESPVDFGRLPAKVQDSFNMAHKGAKIKSVSKTETSKGIIKYEIEMKKGAGTTELFYTEDGTATHE